MSAVGRERTLPAPCQSRRLPTVGARPGPLPTSHAGESKRSAEAHNYYSPERANERVDQTKEHNSPDKCKGELVTADRRHA
jgi:hypothetical protein